MAKPTVKYVLPGLRTGGVEIAIGLAYSAIASQLDIEYIVLDSESPESRLAPATTLTLNAFLVLLRGRKRHLLVTSLWRAHLVGLMVRIFGGNWTAFFHNSVCSGHLIDRLVCQVAAKFATNCIFDSPQTKLEFESRTGRLRGAIVPFIFPTEEFDRAHMGRGCDIVFVGRFVPTKRIDLCVQLCKECVALDSNFKASFIGFGPLQSAIANLSTACPDNVALPGLLSNSAARQEMRNSKMILCLSDVEGMAMAVVEGIQEGCVPVARQVGEMKNYLDHESAIIHADGESISALAKRVVNLRNDELALARMNANARLNIEKYGDYSTAFVSAIRAIAEVQFGSES